MKKTELIFMEHFDPNESKGNAAKKYIVEFNNKVNCNWLWDAIAEALKKHYKDRAEAEEGK